MTSEKKIQQEEIRLLQEEKNSLQTKLDYYANLLSKKEEELKLTQTQVSNLEGMVEYMRIKSRAKRIVKKTLPTGLEKLLKKFIQTSRTTLNNLNGIYFYKPGISKNSALKKIAHFKKKPLVSIIMPVYNVETRWLEAAIKSVKDQYYDNWELCIADDHSPSPETLSVLRNINDPKIKIVFLTENGHISKASNEALKLASGEYVAFLDNDDLLTNDALFEMVDCINAQNPDIIYSDEDKVNETGEYFFPHYKPDFSPDLLTSQNYICHFLLIRKSIVDEVGGFEVGLEGSQDYDLILKCTEKTKNIAHIPKVLYHWRAIEGSTAVTISSKSYAHKAMIHALSNHAQRSHINATVIEGKYPCTCRLQRQIEGNPLVSIIIPFRDKPELLQMCIDSILRKSTYTNFEIIGVSNSSSEEKTLSIMKEYENKDSRIKFYEYNFAFNFSAISNFGVKLCKGEQIILLNNDIEIITSEWIEALLEHSQRKEVGVVGAKLYYPNETIQHAGVVMGVLGLAGHIHKHFGRHDPGYHTRLNLIQNFSAVTAACMMVKKELYDTVEGFNEAHLTIAFNDIDFCLRIKNLGYLNVFTPYCEAYHHESISRGQEDTPMKQARFQKEVYYMMDKHREILQKGDPYYNPNLTLKYENFSLK